MDQSPENLSRHGSQAFDVTPARGAQLLLYSSTFSTQRNTKAAHRLFKLSSKFKRLLALASAIGVFALVLITFSAISPNWETVEFIFPRIVQRACSKQSSPNWTLSYILVDGPGNRITRFDNKMTWDTCQQWKNPTRKIIGAGIGNGTSKNSAVTEILNIVSGAFQVCYEKRGK